jgi:hypothetical protein
MASKEIKYIGGHVTAVAEEKEQQGVNGMPVGIVEGYIATFDVDRGEDINNLNMSRASGAILKRSFDGRTTNIVMTETQAAAEVSVWDSSRKMWSLSAA